MGYAKGLEYKIGKGLEQRINKSSGILSKSSL